MKSDLICVAGPTSSGKTGYALTLAKQLDASIISADSRMVFSSLDIGTGKPTWEYRKFNHSPWIQPTQHLTMGSVYEIEGVDHYLLDIMPPETPFSLSDWLEHTLPVIDYLSTQNKPVIVVGGTSLYIKALIEGYVPPPTNPKVRGEIETLETEKIFEELKKVDPVTATRERQNRRRLIRALEVFRLTGKPMSAHRNQKPLPANLIILSRPRPELFARIDQRIDERLKAGMIQEVESLIKNGVSTEWLIRLGLEYRVITEWLQDNKREEGELIARLRKEIHAYARRQETFLRTQFKIYRPHTYKMALKESNEN